MDSNSGIAHPLKQPPRAIRVSYLSKASRIQASGSIISAVSAVPSYAAPFVEAEGADEVGGTEAAGGKPHHRGDGVY